MKKLFDSIELGEAESKNPAQPQRTTQFYLGGRENQLQLTPKFCTCEVSMKELNILSPTEVVSNLYQPRKTNNDIKVASEILKVNPTLRCFLSLTLKLAYDFRPNCTPLSSNTIINKHKTDTQNKSYKKSQRRNSYNFIYFQIWIRVNRLPNNPPLFLTILPDMSPRSNQKAALGQRSTLIKHKTSASYKLEPAIWSCGTGQRIT